jgi:hypothetical protein
VNATKRSHKKTIYADVSNLHSLNFKVPMILRARFPSKLLKVRERTILICYNLTKKRAEKSQVTNIILNMSPMKKLIIVTKKRAIYKRQEMNIKVSPKSRDL